MVVKEIASEFRDKFKNDGALKKSALDAAIQGINGKSGEDPVTKHFQTALSGIDFSGKAKADAKGTVSERIAFLQQDLEKEFTKQFYISQSEISSANSKPTAAEKIDAYTALFNKAGFYVVGSGISSEKVPSSDESGGAVGEYLKEASGAISELDERILKQREEAFKSAFA